MTTGKELQSNKYINALTLVFTYKLIMLTTVPITIRRELFQCRVLLFTIIKEDSDPGLISVRILAPQIQCKGPISNNSLCGWVEPTSTVRIVDTKCFETVAIVL